MQFSSYKALCADPTTQAQFLETLTVTLAAIPQELKQREAIAAVSVGGQPLSISKYLCTLDMESSDWECDDNAEGAARFVAAAKAMVSVYPFIDVPTFTHRFSNMPGADVTAPVRAEKFDSGVSAHLIAPPTVRGAILKPITERVTVTTESSNENARRMRA